VKSATVSRGFVVRQLPASSEIEVSVKPDARAGELTGEVLLTFEVVTRLIVPLHAIVER
jgi:hypothetical protein